MKRACVIGWPVEHSRSPLIHRYWLDLYQIEGDYVKEAVPPQELAGFLRTLSERGYAGANITVPHKEAAYRLANQADGFAIAIEAVNTLWVERGILKASNTDTHGFLKNLDECAPGWDAGRGAAVVLGAGGAARAIIISLVSRNFTEIRLLNRTRSRAETLAQKFGWAIKVLDWQDWRTALAGAAILVNSTTLGMTGAPPLEIDLTPLPAGAVVTDIVYTPLQTALLRQAEAHGCRIVDGLGMLLHQAAPGFEKWFGIRPEVTPALRAIIASDIGRR